MNENVTDGEVRYESVFRASWRDRQTAGARPGELIKNPRWLDAGLAALIVLLMAGAVTVGTVTVEQTATLPAIVQGTTLTADRAAGPPPPPSPGAAVQFRHAFGLPVDAVVVDVTATEVTARLQEPTPATAGELVVPAERQRLIDVFLPRFW
ncbi:hypothetical protein [Mycobacterium neglectum]|uniref:hypothetical protein n=1 Tax=Mycobacterium neglectum TaxID=242737 RepID=UPI000BFEE568|nr:hypothetical protein [Mycobacterium neglectum]